MDKRKWMHAAIDLSKKVDPQEVPIAAIIIKNDQILAEAVNTKESEQNPLGHAEINAIELAAKKLGSWRLEDCELYVTLEPCLMCSGAIIQARIAQVNFAAYDPKGGAVCSCLQAFDTPKINHRPTWEGGILEDLASEHLSNFFKNLRNN